MLKTCALLFAAAAITILASQTHAQHAGWTLFGEPNEAAADVPAEQQAVHPITSPYFNEDAFITTDLRLWYVYHNFPTSPLGGGDAQVVALQARVALTDRIALLAVKDGYIWFDTPGLNNDGWNDIAAAVKWNVVQDWDTQLHISFGAGYEFKTGDGGVLQNDDEIRAFASINKGFDRLHLGFNFNYFWRVDGQDPAGDSDRIQWHAHADYYLIDFFSPVVEVNSYHIVDAGTSALPFHGVDVGNFGVGEDDYVITLGIGGEFRVPNVPDLGIRVAYETPLTKEVDLFGYRWTASLVWSF